MKYVKSFDEFKSELANNEELQTEFKNDPKRAIQNIEERNPLEYDVFIYRIVVSAISGSLIIIQVGIIILFSIGIFKDDKSVPTIFTAIASAAIGALAGLLAPSPRNPKQ
jgi:hypothetical protein